MNAREREETGLRTKKTKQIYETYKEKRRII